MECAKEDEVEVSFFKVLYFMEDVILHCRCGGQFPAYSRRRPSLEEPGDNCMYDHRCRGDGVDYDDADVLASDSLDFAEADLLLCKIITCFS